MMKRNKYIRSRGRISLSIAFLAAFLLLSPMTAHSAEDTINIGFLAALSGPDAGWGLPGLTGNEIFIDRVNADGGLLVGGKKYKLKMHAFDDEATGSKALQGARQLVLEHDQSLGPKFG